MNIYVSTGIIFLDTQNLVALRMSFDGVASLIFPNSYHDYCAISDILNINQPTKEQQTSKECRHELVIMSFDICKSLAPICMFFAYNSHRFFFAAPVFGKLNMPFLCSKLLKTTSTHNNGTL